MKEFASTDVETHRDDRGCAEAVRTPVDARRRGRKADAHYHPLKDYEEWYVDRMVAT